MKYDENTSRVRLVAKASSGIVMTSGVTPDSLKDFVDTYKTTSMGIDEYTTTNRKTDK